MGPGDQKDWSATSRSSNNRRKRSPGGRQNALASILGRLGGIGGIGVAGAGRTLQNRIRASIFRRTRAVMPSFLPSWSAGDRVASRPRGAYPVSVNVRVGSDNGHQVLVPIAFKGPMQTTRCCSIAHCRCRCFLAQTLSYIVSNRPPRASVVRIGSVQNLSHIWSGDGFGLRDLRLIERPHVHVALG